MYNFRWIDVNKEHLHTVQKTAELRNNRCLPGRAGRHQQLGEHVFSWAGHSHPVHPYLSGCIPATCMFLPGLERRSLSATRSGTHASKPRPAQEPFLQCPAFLCCLNRHLCSHQRATFPCGPHTQGWQHKRKSHPNRGVWQWQDSGQTCAAKRGLMQTLELAVNEAVEWVQREAKSRQQRVHCGLTWSAFPVGHG